MRVHVQYVVETIQTPIHEFQQFRQFSQISFWPQLLFVCACDKIHQFRNVENFTLFHFAFSNCSIYQGEHLEDFMSVFHTNKHYV